MTHGDLSALDTLLADDLLYTHTNGLVETKASFIESVRTRRVVYSVILPSDLRVTPLGVEAVLVTGRSRMRLGGEGVREFEIRFIEVLVSAPDAGK